MRKMVYSDRAENAPENVWLEFSVMPDGSDPVLEDWHLENPTFLKSKAVRYVRAE